MNEEQYLSIKEFAAKAGVSTQAIYQRIAKDLQPYLKSEKGKKTISTEALQLFATGEQTPELTSELQIILNTLQLQLAEKDKQLENKDKQLAEKDKQLAENGVQISQLTNALMNEQRSAQQAHALHAGTIQQSIDCKERKGIFSKWFRKRVKNEKI